MNETMQSPFVNINTLAEFKKALREHKLPLYVWVSWEGNDGSYIEVSRAKFLHGIGAHHPVTTIQAEVRLGDGIYIG
jgi:hypothetical protein